MSRNFPAHDFRPASEAFDSAAFASPALFNNLLAMSNRGGNPMRHALEVARIKHLIASCAWTDAALALLALDLPRWQLRRLAYDDGAWHCALSKNREMPDWLDSAIETHHPDMALAILSAIMQARHDSLGATLPVVEMGPEAPDASWQPALCDNFA